MSNKNIRWFFNVGKWNPTPAELQLSSTCIQLEEKERIAKFVFKKDFKSSLIGRLMMRKFVCESTGLEYNKIVIKRDSKGKPFVSEDQVNFNVSHHGNYVVLAGLKDDRKIGIDIMKLEYTGGKSLPEFFRIMTKNFSHSEWNCIKHSGNEKQQIAMFCRNWCLKESYVKAEGVGITINLQDIAFKIKTNTLSKGEITNDTELFITGRKVNWEFQETLLDDDHCVAVALNAQNNEKILFKELAFDDLMSNAIPILEVDRRYCENYCMKLDK